MAGCQQALRELLTVFVYASCSQHTYKKLSDLLSCMQVARTRLLPSALKTLAASKTVQLPIRLFEISDVVLLDSGKDVGARNERRMIAVNANRESGFEIIHGVLNRIMEVLGVPYAGDAGATGVKEEGGRKSKAAKSSCAPHFMHALSPVMGNLVSVFTELKAKSNAKACEKIEAELHSHLLHTHLI